MNTGTMPIWFSFEVPKDTVLDSTNNRFYSSLYAPSGTGGAQPTNEVIVIFYGSDSTTGLPDTMLDYHYLTHSDGTSGNYLFEFGNDWNVDGTQKLEANKNYWLAFQHLQGDTNQKAWVRYASNSSRWGHNGSYSASIGSAGNIYGPGPYFRGPQNLLQGNGVPFSTFPDLLTNGYRNQMQTTIPAFEVRYT